jgi:BirA family biotin operon repressor/biotin-[acetyl-CoA-carboxylase] ligase
LNRLDPSMDGSPDVFEELRQTRKNRLIGNEIVFLPEVDSTNLEASRMARQGTREGVVVLADSQSQGKGRGGRSWSSPPGVNLYFSIILRPALAPAEVPQIPLLAGLAVARAFVRISGLEARIKWPNDILLRGKKAAGILAEMEGVGDEIRFIILGVGCNVNWEKERMPPDLQKTATSLRAETGRELSRYRVAERIFEELEPAYRFYLKEKFSHRLRKEWNSLSWVNGKQVTIASGDQEFSGEALGLDEIGALLIRDCRGEIQRVIAGDVSLRL